VARAGDTPYAKRREGLREGIGKELPGEAKYHRNENRDCVINDWGRKCVEKLGERKELITSAEWNCKEGELQTRDEEGKSP